MIRRSKYRTIFDRLFDVKDDPAKLKGVLNRLKRVNTWIIKVPLTVESIHQEACFKTCQGRQK